MWPVLKTSNRPQKDIYHITSLADLGEKEPFDLILSDMAPQTTGIKVVDQSKNLELVEHVLGLLPSFLKTGGHFVVKIFEGGESRQTVKKGQLLFNTTHIFRPKSTRSSSKEFFFIGKNFRP